MEVDPVLQLKSMLMAVGAMALVALGYWMGRADGYNKGHSVGWDVGYWRAMNTAAAMTRRYVELIPKIAPGVAANLVPQAANDLLDAANAAERRVPEKERRWG